MTYQAGISIPGHYNGGPHFLCDVCGRRYDVRGSKPAGAPPAWLLAGNAPPRWKKLDNGEHECPSCKSYTLAEREFVDGISKKLRMAGEVALPKPAKPKNKRKPMKPRVCDRIIETLCEDGEGPGWTIDELRDDIKSSTQAVQSAVAHLVADGQLAILDAPEDTGLGFKVRVTRYRLKGKPCEQEM